MRTSLATMTALCLLAVFGGGRCAHAATTGGGDSIVEEVFKALPEGTTGDDTMRKADASATVRSPNTEGAPALVKSETAASTTKLTAHAETGGESSSFTLTEREKEAYIARCKAIEEDMYEGGRYGSPRYIARKNLALRRVIRQAKELQFSQHMIDEIAKLFRLREYIHYQYDVGTGIHPNNDAIVKRNLARRMRRNKAILKRNPSFGSESGLIISPDDLFVSESGVVMKKEKKEKKKEKKAAQRRETTTPDYSRFSGEGGVYASKERKHSAAPEEVVMKELPPEVIKSIEAKVHNSILEKLRNKGFNVAALNVFLQTLEEIKVIVIVTTSELPNSAIRPTLKRIRHIIEDEVLKREFPTLKLAQLSSFTILNEVDNHFYEYPVLYWKMLLPGWEVEGKEVVPGGTASIGKHGFEEKRPAADTKEFDFLSDFLENYSMEN